MKSGDAYDSIKFQEFYERRNGRNEKQHFIKFTRKEVKTMQQVFHLSNSEKEHCLHLIDNNNPKDNLMFLGNINNQESVFLMLHGTLDGRVKFNNNYYTLAQLYQVLKKENTFNLITHILGIKCFNILCCHSYYIDDYEKDGITLKTVFNNKGYVEVTLDTKTNTCLVEEVA